MPSGYLRILSDATRTSSHCSNGAGSSARPAPTIRRPRYRQRSSAPFVALIWSRDALVALVLRPVGGRLQPEAAALRATCALRTRLRAASARQAAKRLQVTGLMFAMECAILPLHFLITYVSQYCNGRPRIIEFQPERRTSGRNNAGAVLLPFPQQYPYGFASYKLLKGFSSGTRLTLLKPACSQSSRTFAS